MGQPHRADAFGQTTSLRRSISISGRASRAITRSSFTRAPYRHAHILGDTGSRKTSIGIAPAPHPAHRPREFIGPHHRPEGRHEPLRGGTRGGEASRAFRSSGSRTSPDFRASSSTRSDRATCRSLTTNQLTQGILQALALEYGEDYGRGYYSALNELVLATYMKHHRKHIRSFKELHALRLRPGCVPRHRESRRLGEDAAPRGSRR